MLVGFTRAILICSKEQNYEFSIAWMLKVDRNEKSGGYTRGYVYVKLVKK